MRPLLQISEVGLDLFQVGSLHLPILCNLITTSLETLALGGDLLKAMRFAGVELRQGSIVRLLDLILGEVLPTGWARVNVIVLEHLGIDALPLATKVRHA